MVGPRTDPRPPLRKLPSTLLKVSEVCSTGAFVCLILAFRWWTWAVLWSMFTLGIAGLLCGVLAVVIDIRDLRDLRGRVSQ